LLIISKFSVKSLPHAIVSYSSLTLCDLTLIKHALCPTPGRLTYFAMTTVLDTLLSREPPLSRILVYSDSKLYFHNHLDFLFSKCIKLLGLIRSITFSFSSLDCLFVLYTALVRSQLEYASVVWNSITATDSKMLERIQQKFASVCFCRFFLCLPYSYNFALKKLNLPSLRTRRHHLDALFFIQA
jgi:hypothetical protein